MEGEDANKTPPFGTSQRVGQGSGGANTSSYTPKKTRRTDLADRFYPSETDCYGGDYEDLHWEVYGLGWDEASKDKVQFNNPYTMFKDQASDDAIWNPKLHEAYREGFQAFFTYQREQKSKVDADTAKKAFTSAAKVKKIQEQKPDIVKPAANKTAVGQLIDQKENKKVTPISAALKYDGPNGKKISAGKFEELTGHVCGWCESKFNPDNDKGKFVEMEVPTATPTATPKKEMVYVCEECISDPVQLQLIKAESKHA